MINFEQAEKEVIATLVSSMGMIAWVLMSDMEQQLAISNEMWGD